MPDFNAAVRDVFCDVLQSLAFMFGDPVEKDGLAAIEGPYMTASIGFSGPMRGTLTMLAPQSLAHELACNILGVDPAEDGTADQACDALGELMNVTLGRVLTTIAGDAPVFDLTPPDVADSDGAAWRLAMESDITFAVFVDDRPVLLSFELLASEATAEPLSRTES